MNAEELQVNAGPNPARARQLAIELLAYNSPDDEGLHSAAGLALLDLATFIEGWSIRTLVLGQRFLELYPDAPEIQPEATEEWYRGYINGIVDVLESLQARPLTPISAASEDDVSATGDDDV